jgi:catechol 2,3-dioxygenase-like lactoylglutathione lyase family enzyme
MMEQRDRAVTMASRMAVFSTKDIPLIRRSMMNDPRPDIAIGHVRLLVGDVAKTTEFFVKLGIRTIVDHAEFAVLELRGGTHLVLRPWEEPDGSPVPFDIMVDDIDAAHRCIQGHGMAVTAINRGRIHDHFEVQTPDHRALTINSSHAGDRAV